MWMSAQLIARAKIIEASKWEAKIVEQKVVDIDRYFDWLKWLWQASKINLINNWYRTIEDLRGKTKEDLLRVWLNYISITNILRHFEEEAIKNNYEEVRKKEEDWLDWNLPNWETIELDTTNNITVTKTKNEK